MMKKEKADIYSSAGTTAESDSTVKDISFSQPIAKPNVGCCTSSESKLYYVRNCFWWIEEYFKGNQPKEQAKQAINALRKHIG